MCTAISSKGKKHFFGRNLDFEHSFGELFLITPRNFPMSFRHAEPINTHFALLGMGIVQDSFPLYFDAVNEKGLCVAGLLFTGFAHYHNIDKTRTNLAPFEIIPWILAQCACAKEAKALLQGINIVDTHFSSEYPNTPLHWIISDKNESIVLESIAEGVFIYDNPPCVLTNSPPFPLQLFNLNNFMGLSPYPPENTFSPELKLSTYSRGMGSIGLPGDFSSSSRFVRAAFLNSHADTEDNPELFSDILKNLSPLPGSVLNEKNEKETTIYSSCIDSEKGIYYCKTFGSTTPYAVDMHTHNLNSDTLLTFRLPSATFSYNLLH